MMRNIKHKVFWMALYKLVTGEGIEPSESLRLELEAWQRVDPSQNWRPGSGMILPRIGGLAAE